MENLPVPTNLYTHAVAFYQHAKGLDAANRIAQGLVNIAQQSESLGMSLVAVQGSEGFWQKLGFVKDEKIDVPEKYRDCSIYEVAISERGMLTIWIAHTSFNMAYVAVIVSSRLREMDKSLEEAAMDLGANKRMVLFFITLPIVAPALF